MSNSRRIRLDIAIALLSAVLTGCSSAPTVTPVAPVATASAPRTLAVNKPVLDHFELAIELLQNGEPQQAEAELQASLKESPGNHAAQILIGQIESPLNKLFPADNFPLELSKDESLSSVAKLYLGDPLLFYALARYNGIAIPAKVNAGQTIKIPRTAKAIAQQQSVAAATKAKGVAPTPVIEPKSKPDLHAVAEREYKKGLIAFQRQDLNGAIAAWDKVLAIDPNYKDAQINRAQAMRLKENLKKLQH